MKAKKVFETLNFKRGIEPKDSLGIGAIHKLEQQWDELQKHSGSIDVNSWKDRMYIKIWVSRFPGDSSRKDVIVQEIMGEYLSGNDSSDTSHNYYEIKPEFHSIFKEFWARKWPEENIGDVNDDDENHYKVLDILSRKKIK